MSLPNQHYCVCLLVSGLLSFTARSQPSVTDTSLNIPIREYHSYLTPEAGLYRGRQYIVYAHMLHEGHPYFDRDQMRPGSVLYKGILYKDVPLLLDLVKSSLVINDAQKIYKIALINEEIDSFTIEDNRFIHFRDSTNGTLRPGFYQLLHQGRVTLLKKEKKSIRQQIDYMTVNQYIDYYVDYYLKKDGAWFPVNNERELLHAFGGNGPALKKFLRKNKLKVRKDKENSLLQSAVWYDGLQP